MKTIKLKKNLNVNFTPRDVKFYKYMLPDTLGNAEAEEIAARYVTICQAKNEWPDFRLRDFTETLDEDLKNIDEVSKKVHTLITLDRFKMSRPNFAETGFSNLINGKYITFEIEENDVRIFPTKKLLKAIEKYAQ